MTTKPDYLIKAEMDATAAFDALAVPVAKAGGRTYQQWLRDGEAYCRAHPENLKAARECSELRRRYATLCDAVARTVRAYDAAWDRALAETGENPDAWPYEAETAASLEAQGQRTAKALAERAA